MQERKPPVPGITFGDPVQVNPATPNYSQLVSLVGLFVFSLASFRQAWFVLPENKNPVACMLRALSDAFGGEREGRALSPDMLCRDSEEPACRRGNPRSPGLTPLPTFVGIVVDPIGENLAELK